MERKTAAVIFGGQSSEHEVSCMSAANVIDRINKEKYDLLLIGITMDGHWIKTDSVDDIRSGEWRNGKVSGKAGRGRWTGHDSGFLFFGATFFKYV